MADAGKMVDKQILRSLVPANVLNAENFKEFASKARLEEIPAGRFLFKKGEMDRKTVYVLSGDVEMAGDGEAKVVKGGTPEGRRPLANKQPRQMTARTRSSCTVTRFDSDLLDILLTWDQLSGIEVSDITVSGQDFDEDEEDSGGDWMTRILQSKAFLRIPPANIQAMFMRLQEVPVKADQSIIEQGDEGDYYYIICRGKCKVMRKSASGSSVTLAQLSDGDAFGEEALLKETPLSRWKQTDCSCVCRSPISKSCLKLPSMSHLKKRREWSKAEQSCSMFGWKVSTRRAVSKVVRTSRCLCCD